MPSFIKDPDARLDYRVDWVADGWLATGEQIVTSTWIVPAGITNDADDHDTGTAWVWLTGGTAGQTYRVTNRVTTNQQRTDDRTITIVVADR